MSQRFWFMLGVDAMGAEDPWLVAEARYEAYRRRVEREMREARSQ